MTKPVNPSGLGSIVAVIPAAGVGSRMKAQCPKQYLTVAGQTVLQHSVTRLLEHPQVAAAVIAVSAEDGYIESLSWPTAKPVYLVEGGAERADSVLAAVHYAKAKLGAEWALVHDAARPCLRASDLDKLIQIVCTEPERSGGILAAPVRDTMKRGERGRIDHTVERVELWHAQTPQLFPAANLEKVLSEALAQGVTITDEASAFEWAGESPHLVESHADNIKITHPEDLALASFYLQQELS